MKIINFADSKSVINQYVAELRDIHIQSDRNTFRHNLQRIGQMMAYEVSKTLNYSEKEVQTPLAMAKAYTHDDEVVLATGGSLQLAYEALCTKGTPKHLHLCCVIASKVGVENIMKMFKPLDNVTLWCAAIDPILNEHKYIVPGLGDAGDLAYGDKI